MEGSQKRKNDDQKGKKLKKKKKHLLSDTHDAEAGENHELRKTNDITSDNSFEKKNKKHKKKKPRQEQSFLDKFNGEEESPMTAKRSNVSASGDYQKKMKDKKKDKKYKMKKIRQEQPLMYMSDEDDEVQYGAKAVEDVLNEVNENKGKGLLTGFGIIFVVTLLFVCVFVCFVPLFCCFVLLECVKGKTVRDRLCASF